MPHVQEWPYRRAAFNCALVGGTLLALLAPGVSGAKLFAMPFIAVFSAGAGYLMGWLLLKFHGAIWGAVFPGAFKALCLVFFYLFGFGGVVQLPLVPLNPDVPLELVAATICAGAGAAAGAYRVIEDYRAVV